MPRRRKKSKKKNEDRIIEMEEKMTKENLKMKKLLMPIMNKGEK